MLGDFQTESRNFNVVMRKTRLAQSRQRPVTFTSKSILTALTGHWNSFGKHLRTSRWEAEPAADCWAHVQRSACCVNRRLCVLFFNLAAGTWPWIWPCPSPWIVTSELNRVQRLFPSVSQKHFNFGHVSYILPLIESFFLSFHCTSFQWRTTSGDNVLETLRS